MDGFPGNCGHITNMLGHIAGFKTKTSLKQINTDNVVQKFFFFGDPKTLFPFQKSKVDNQSRTKKKNV